MRTGLALGVYGLCALYVVLSCVQVVTAVKCLVCPGSKLSNCALPSSSKEKVTYEEANCTACGKLVSWNPKPPTQRNYVGLRGTVRSLEYKYCVTTVDWLGCYKSESAVTTSIECVCNSDGCNGAGRPASVGPWALTLPLIAAAWALAL